MTLEETSKKIKLYVIEIVPGSTVIFYRFVSLIDGMRGAQYCSEGAAIEEAENYTRIQLILHPELSEIVEV